MNNCKLRILFLVVLFVLSFAKNADASVIVRPAMIHMGLVGYWNFDVGKGDLTAIDMSGQGNNGTLTNMDETTDWVDSKTGSMGRALDFDGSDDYVNVTSDVGGSSLIQTVSFWMNASDVTTRDIIDFDGTDQIDISAGSAIQATNFPAATVYVDGVIASAVTADAWHFITVTDTTGVDVSALQIGREASDSTNEFAGKLDEIRLYERILSATEIERLYKLQVGTVINTTAGGGSGTDDIVDMFVWRGVADANIPEYKTRNNSGFSAEGTAADHTSNMNYIAMASDPGGSSEVIFCTTDGAADLNCQVWNGSSWSNTELVTSNNSNYEVDIEYERSSDTAMVCYSEPTDNSVPACNIWNGTNWTTEADAADVTGTIQRLQMYPDPNSDYIAMCTGDNGGDVNCQIWDGSSWGNLLEVEDNDGTCSSCFTFHGGWETNSDDFVVVWFDGTGGTDEFQAREFDKTTLWGSEIADVVQHANFAGTSNVLIESASDPTAGSDDVVFIMSADDDVLYSRTWTGSSFNATTTLSSSFGGVSSFTNNHLASIAFEKGGDNDAVVTYGTTNTALKYKVWDSGTDAWGSEQSLPTSTQDSEFMFLVSDPKSTNIMLAMNGAGTNSNLETLEWTGSSWEADYTTHETTAQTTPTFAFVYDYEDESGGGGTGQITTINSRGPGSLKNGLVGYWNFDVGKGDLTAIDMSGQGNNGTLTNMDETTDWVDSKKGSMGRALDFDGTNDFVDIPDFVNVSGPFAIMAWMKYNSGTNAVPLGGTGSTNYMMNIQFSAGANQGLNFCGANRIVNVLPTVDVWTQLVFSRDSGDIITAYQDGVAVGSKSATTDTCEFSAIGANASGVNPAPTQMDEVRFYNRALSADEIRRLYNSGR